MTIGSHGMDHRPWRGLAPSDRYREVVSARRILSDVISAQVDEAAPPLGRYDRRLLKDLREQGYRRVFSSDRRSATAGDWFQPRYSARATET